jgi:hypothetical protein
VKDRTPKVLNSHGLSMHACILVYYVRTYVGGPLSWHLRIIVVIKLHLMSEQ